MTARRLRLFLVGAVCAGQSAGAAWGATIEITVREVRSERGMIRVGICNRQEFLSERCAYHAVVPAKLGAVTVRLADVAPGDYAVAAFQDLDGSGKLKRSFLGLPKEDLGFSRNPPMRFGPPSFADAEFTVGSRDQQVALSLHPYGPD